MTFCGPYQRPLRNHESLQQHLKDSLQHGYCDRCEKAFNSDRAKQQHLQASSRHNVCIRYPCFADFETRRELDVHLCASNSYSRSGGTPPASMLEDTLVEYLGLHRSIIAPVFACAVRHRYAQPTVDILVRQTKTILDHAIVSALLAAALRLLPVDNSTQGVAIRMEKDRMRAAEAKRAERAFLADFDRLGYDFVGEDEQRGTSSSNPDIRFNKPTLICGHLCWWVECKNFFGFRANPYVAQSNKKQFMKYEMQIGPGAVVYKLGYETGHVDLEGVRGFREQDSSASELDSTVGALMTYHDSIYVTWLLLVQRVRWFGVSYSKNMVSSY